ERLEGPAVHVAGVVDEHVEAATVLHGYVDHRRPVGVDGDVADHGGAGVADRRCDAGDLVGAASRDRDARPGGTEVAGDTLADPGPAAGHEHRHPCDRPHAASSVTHASAWPSSRAWSGWRSDDTSWPRAS